jgi:hypothetical protein
MYHPMIINPALSLLTTSFLVVFINFSVVVQALRILAFGTGIAYGSVKLGYLKVRT